MSLHRALPTLFVILLFVPLALPSSASSTTVVTITPGRDGLVIDPWHVEVDSSTTIEWQLIGHMANIRARDGTLWCELTAATPTCQRTFTGLGHHGYYAETLYPQEVWLDTDPTSVGPESFESRTSAAVNVFSDSSSLEVLEINDIAQNTVLTYERSVDLVLVSDGHWTSVFEGPGYSCQASYRGDYCLYSLTELGTHRLTHRYVGASFSWSVDIQIQGDDPTIDISSPTTGSSVTTPFTVTGTASAEAGVDQVHVRLADGPWRLASGTDSWSFTADSEGLRQGPLDVTARTTAADGQTEETTRTVTLTHRGTANLEIKQLYVGDWSRPFDGGCLHFTCVVNPVAYQQPYMVVEAANHGNLEITPKLRLEYYESGAWRVLDELNWTLSPGTGYLEWFWVDPVRTGKWVVRATIDADDEFLEVDEANNEKRRFVSFPGAGEPLPSANGGRTLSRAEHEYNETPLGNEAPSPGVAPLVDGGTAIRWLPV